MISAAFPITTSLMDALETTNTQSREEGASVV